jgi:hypothetical protein
MQKIKTMVRQRSQSIEDGGISGPGQGQGSSSRGNLNLVVSGPMAGQLVSPGGLSEGDRVQEGEEYTSRARRGSEDDEIFGGMSPDKERAYTPPTRQGGHGHGQRF